MLFDQSVSIGVYSILFVVAAMTKLLAAFEELRIYNALLLSALFLCVGIAFSLYGLKVAFQFSGDSENRSYNTRKSAVIRRVLLLSTITPLAFWARGIYEGAVGTKLIGAEWKGYSIHFWDAIMIIVSEWFPAQLVLALFWPPRREHPSASTAANRLYNQTDARMPLLDPNCGSTATGPTVEGGKDVLLNFVPQSIYPLTSPTGARYP
ncbi:putative transmembrane protein [Gregarina niphandrodes]|uniref:Transmembrane protein n=1 Tax=Gregarina niphandrodes TaxID=110365 RepID=A0A023B7U4_GRENI|nr:putative transmembrane protein [Gregarina niphandrodes]EZG67825.1 putative transmembrane protein [Gregarina niphandrodes]|eukprot:XP_011130149.1 putative transmembrane protein [Gregarina niphandrodes]